MTVTVTALVVFEPLVLGAEAGTVIEALIVDALVDVILPLIIELESASLVPAEPIFTLYPIYGVELSAVVAPCPICIIHCDLRF